MQYKSRVDHSVQNAENFITFMKTEQRKTKSQDWFDHQFRKITASKIYAKSRCKTAECALTEAILGTEATNRGKKLDPQVLAEVENAKKIKIAPCGLLLNPQFSIFGASPDRISDEHIIEVTFPGKQRP